MNKPTITLHCGDIGQQVMEFIINQGLVWVDPQVVKPEYSGGLMIWSVNAAEQITEFIKELDNDSKRS
jgi:hypothetical protein